MMILVVSFILILFSLLSSSVSSLRPKSRKFKSYSFSERLYSSYNNDVNTLSKSMKTLNKSIQLLIVTIPLLVINPNIGCAATAQNPPDLISQLQQIQKAQDALDSADIPFVDLPLGGSYREFRAGRGNKVVQKGSEITAEMTIRCVKFATAADPGGVKYYDTKVDSPDKQLIWVIGDGSLPPSLEEGLIGMKKLGVRRIEIPSVEVFQARKNNQLPLPSKKNDDGNRRYKNLFKTDATLLFEVLVKSISDPVTE